MTTLLLGSAGQLGRALQAARGASAPAWIDADRHVEGGRLGVDATDPLALRRLLDDSRPDVIVNASAWTAVDAAESNEELAARINADAVQVLGEWASRHEALVVHVSTDYVFDGASKRPYLESDVPAPQNAYGRTKLAGEQALVASGAAHMILRTAWLYSADGPSFLQTVLRLADERDQVRIVADQRGSPTPASLLADAIITATGAWTSRPAHDRPALEGLFHVVAAGETTWYGFTEAIIRGAVKRGILLRAPTVEPITTAEYPTPARRPAYSVLDSSRFESVFSRRMPDWESQLQHVLDTIKPLI
ncbi:dTDP-4-dehydrorhamnose reductase [Luteibacter yeojuensis]|uniref:dTDP-4-dehydrorhamnose reductase n=1 Tax=Luteibacter yeojuensis TaxID=345309 RepID=A0A0F3KK85_9GAMM|nr:dTDP-4-dehydrorhamnose reductase [Luteibacter yeojuensis]KJV31655.1 hypothetical protein VI08_13405 [Luteibacter yeojuensis]